MTRILGDPDSSGDEGGAVSSSTPFETLNEEATPEEYSPAFSNAKEHIASSGRPSTSLRSSPTSRADVSPTLSEKTALVGDEQASTSNHHQATSPLSSSNHRNHRQHPAPQHLTLEIDPCSGGFENNTLDEMRDENELFQQRPHPTSVILTTTSGNSALRKDTSSETRLHPYHEDNATRTSKSRTNRLSVSQLLLQCVCSLWHMLWQEQVWKFLLAGLYLISVMFFISQLLVLVYLRVPTNDTYGSWAKPLPDLLLEVIPRQPWGFTASEFMISTLSSSTFLLIIFHQNRLVVARRFCCIAGSIFLLRSACVVVTSLTQCSPHLAEVCPPLMQNISSSEFFARGVRIFLGVGMRIQGGQSCGDYIYSGHTCSLTIFNLILLTYLPRHWLFWPLKALTCLLNAFGAFCILLAHEHYTVDVILGFAITIMVFTEYHDIAHNPELRRRDRLRVCLTSPLAYFMERNGEGKLINRLTFPIYHHWIMHKWSQFRLGRQKRNKADQQSERVL